PDLLAAARRDFTAVRCSDEETLAAMRAHHERTGQLIDPHTAVALHAARRAVAENGGDTGAPTVVVSTAHPAKFPDAVERATGILPALPPRLAGIMGRPEHFTPAPNDLQGIKNFIRARARQR